MISWFSVLLLGAAGIIVFTVESIGEQVTQILDKINPFVFVLITTVILAMTCYFLQRAAVRRFRRERLLLN